MRAIDLFRTAWADSALCFHTSRTGAFAICTCSGLERLAGQVPKLLAEANAINKGETLAAGSRWARQAGRTDAGYQVRHGPFLAGRDTEYLGT